MLWRGLDLTFDFAIVTLTYKILSGLYLRKHKMAQVDTWKGHWLGGCRCAMSWCDLDLTFDFAVMTLTYKIISKLNLGNRGKLTLGRDIGWDLYVCNVMV